MMSRIKVVFRREVLHHINRVVWCLVKRFDYNIQGHINQFCLKYRGIISKLLAILRFCLGGSLILLQRRKGKHKIMVRAFQVDILILDSINA